jgi:hypothetical protein
VTFGFMYVSCETVQNIQFACEPVQNIQFACQRTQILVVKASGCSNVR